MKDEIFNMNFEIKDSIVNKPLPRLIVRVKTNCWHDNKGIYMRKNIITLKKKCFECDNFMLEEASMIGADLVFARITNLDDCKDGIYEIITCNLVRDWETGYAEDWDYKLIPYEEQTLLG